LAVAGQINAENLFPLMLCQTVAQLTLIH